MALVLKDRVRESSATSGTGSVTLAGAFTGYQTFDSVVANGSTVYYTIHNTTSPNDGEWEVGVGTFTSPTTLSRDTVLSSSAGGTTKVSFSGSSVLEVFITQPAGEAVYINQATGKVEANGNGSNSISFTNVTSDLFTGNASAISAINASNVSSGTLDNARTTASSSNGANTIVLRDASGNFTANIITANGSAISAINASNISSGTIDNARTTAASANGASTIVLRDSGGSFDANLVNAVSLSGNAATVTGINASNIASGTIANARTTAATANGASTIVLRGASGEFAAGAITGTSFSGDGSAITAINASAITTGTLDNARTTAASANGASTIVLRDANGSFAGNVVTGTTGTFTSVSGNGVALTAINASNISSGTVATARLGSGTANASTFLRGDQTYAVVSSGTLIPSGTVMLFAQTAAPTGFTKNTTTGNNHALRVVTGTASTGGSVAFTTAFASKAVTGTVSISAVSGSAGATTLSTPQIPSHTHGLSVFLGGSGNFAQTSGGGAASGTATTGGAGGGASHTHPFSFSSGTASFSGTAINLAVQYIDVIRATKG